MDELRRIILKEIRGEALYQDEKERIDNISLETLEELYNDYHRIIENERKILGRVERNDIEMWMGDRDFRSKCARISRIHELHNFVTQNYLKRLELSREVQELTILLRVMPENEDLKQKYLNKYKELLICTRNIFDASIEIADARAKDTDYIDKRRTNISTVAEIKAEEVTFLKYIDELVKNFEKPILFYNIESHTKAMEALRTRIEQARHEANLAAQQPATQQQQNSDPTAEREEDLIAQTPTLENQAIPAAAQEEVQGGITAAPSEILPATREVLEEIGTQTEEIVSQEVKTQTEETISEEVEVQTAREMTAVSTTEPVLEEKPTPTTVTVSTNTDPIEYNRAEEPRPYAGILGREIIEQARALYPALGKKISIVDKTLDKIEAIEAKKDTLAEDTKKYKRLSGRITKLQKKINSMSEAKFGTIWQRRKAREMLAGNTIS